MRNKWEEEDREDRLNESKCVSMRVCKFKAAKMAKVSFINAKIAKSKATLRFNVDASFF